MNDQIFDVDFDEAIDTGSSGTQDFNQMFNRPSYDDQPMTSATNIPKVPTSVSELGNDSGYQTAEQVEAAVAEETSARIAVDSALSGAIADETSMRQAADENLNNAITAETTARESADEALQSQIDGITASSDVKDIVGTKAELDAYDTSTLGNNDIIKVLQDESDNGATTYYRWNAATKQFALIGEEGPYYTKSQADALLNAKQNNLAAGENVQIVGNTISATDTTYTAGTGIDITNGVISATGGEGPTVVQTTGTSTTDVMSQNAVTSMVFADPQYGQNVRIGRSSTADANNGIAIGVNAKSTSIGAVAIGGNTVGFNTVASGTLSVALGAGANASGHNSVAVGAGAVAATKGQFDISSSAMNYTGGGYNDSNYRLLTGLYDGQSDHDAATVGQLNTAIAGVSVPNGQSKILTTADYNWPTNNPTSVALWLLPSGIYTGPEDGTFVDVNTSSSGTSRLGAGYPGFVIVSRAVSDSNQRATILLVKPARISCINGVAQSGQYGTTNLLLGQRDIVDSLTSASTTNPLSANQGRMLNDKIGGDLSTLTTVDKTSLIAAINELVTRVAALES